MTAIGKIDVWCEPDNCPASICGGPHREVRTSLGDEILRLGQEPMGQPVTEPPPPELLVKHATTIDVPTDLLADYADMNDLIGKALRGEIELRPLPTPKRHRCLICWLVALLPGHDRCEHGRIACDDCDA